MKNNLTPWQVGTSGNPNGRPRGSRNIKSVIRELLDASETYDLFPENIPRDASTPLEAILCALMTKAMAGDVRAADVILKYAIDREELPVEGGFFDQPQLLIRVIDSKGNPHMQEPLAIDEATGQLVGGSIH